MKREIIRLPVRVIAVLGGLTLLAACENSHSQFANSSQGTLVVDTKPGSSGETGMAREGGGMPEGIARANGYYYYIHNGTAVRLAQHQRFVEGYSYDGRGRIVSRSGRIIRLTNGEMVTFGGDRLPLPPAIVIP